MNRRWLVSALSLASIGIVAGCVAPRNLYRNVTDQRMTKFRLNPAALKYGIATLEDGRWGNALFATSFIMTSHGVILVFENLTESIMTFNWRRCAYVDFGGWTHSIGNPVIESQLGTIRLARRINNGLYMA